MPQPLRCRVCGGQNLEGVLSLGEVPLANALLSEDELGVAEGRYPLDLAFCPDCSLVQLSRSVPPDVLFDEYLYFSSVVEALVVSARDLSSRLVAERSVGADTLVVEVGSNDGYLLGQYRDHGIPVHGVEPARNVADVAEGRGIPTTCAYFGKELGARLRKELGGASVIHAHNVLAHVPDTTGFAAGMATLLAERGVAVVEVPYVREMVDHCEFDTIYHEHLCYFSLHALGRLFAQVGLGIESVERIPLHGGSLRLFLTREAHERMGPSATALLKEEREAGLAGPRYYRRFARQVEERTKEIVDLLKGLKDAGHRMAGYGAAAKATTLLNVAGIGPDMLSFVADRSVHKQGRFIPGARIPIVSPDALLQDMPDYVVVFAWNLAEEIILQQGEYLSRGGRFVIPLPELRIVGAGGEVSPRVALGPDDA